MGQDSKGGKKKDLSKVKCFGCGQLGHYVRQCPKKTRDKKGKQMVTLAEIENLSAILEDEFAMFAILSSDRGGV